MHTGFTIFFMLIVPLPSVCFYSSSSTETPSKLSILIDTPEEFQISSCTFPDNFTLILRTTSGENVSLNLKKESGNVRAPIFVIRENSQGQKVVVRDATISDISDYALYQDVPNDAAMEVKCSLDSSQLQLQFRGSFWHRNTEYELSYDETMMSYEARKKLVATDISHDYRHLKKPIMGVRISESQTLDGAHEVRSRSKREIISVHGPYVIDLLVIVDYQVYKTWYSDSSSLSNEEVDELAKNNLRRYFSHFVNEVDLRFKAIDRSDLRFSVHISGFVICDNESSYPYLESKKETFPNRSRDAVDADKALRDLKDWVWLTNGLPPHDHAILFTGFDLYSEDSSHQRNFHTAGLAFIGSMCRSHGDSVSVVEDHGAFQNVGTAAHEMGHSLGAYHDGESNICSSQDKYIMSASGSGPVPTGKRPNQWHFSNCSVDYFSEFITNITQKGYSCLSETFENVGLNVHEIPGQSYNADTQCRLIWGPESYLCRGYEFGNASTICSAMYCRDPSTNGDCVLHVAARGTTCGNKQWCEGGQCVYSEEAPETGTCILGDQPGTAFVGQTCPELVDSVPAYCYQDKVRARCCESCAKHFTWRRGCEYGDRAKGCQAFHCHMAGNNDTLANDCCGTCGIGEVIPGSDTTDQPPSSTIRVCLDHAFVNKKTCPDFVKNQGPLVCYDPFIESVCCATCRQVNEVYNKKCEYGDLLPELCTSPKNLTSWCETHHSECCRTCNMLISGSSPVQSLTSFISLWLGMLILLFS